MALLTQMTLAEAQALGRGFGLDVAGLEPILRGSVNSNFAVALVGGGRAFLRVCEESPRAAVEQQNRLLAHLCARGVPTPAPLELRGGGTVHEHRGRPVTAFPFCDGEWICQARVDAARLRAVGRALGRIHLAGADFADAPANRFGPEDLAGRVDRLRTGGYGALPSETAAAVERLAAELSRVTTAVERHGAPLVIHGDVFRDNVLWHEGRLSAVLDFESASRGHPAFDLAVTMLAWCFGDALDAGMARALGAGYAEVRPVAAAEREAWFDAACFAAVRFAITRITDYELRPPGVVVYKDFRRFVRRLDALHALGPRGLGALLAP